MQHHSKEDTARIVKAGRIAKGYTQQEVADLAGISLRSVQRIENAEVIPRLYTLKLLAESLDFSFTNVNDAVDPANTTPVLLSALPSHNNVPRKLILSIGSGLLLLLLVAAFLSQSARFPETHFEFIVLLIPIVTFYSLLLFRLWK